MWKGLPLKNIICFFAVTTKCNFVKHQTIIFQFVEIHNVLYDVKKTNYEIELLYLLSKAVHAVWN